VEAVRLNGGVIVSPFPGIEREEIARAAAMVAPLLPPSLAPWFGTHFIRSNSLFDEYVYRLTLQVFTETRLDRAMGDGGTVAEIVARRGFDPRCSLVPVDWMLRHLADRGALQRDDGAAGRLFRAERALPILDPAEMLVLQREHDPGCLPSYALAETAARSYPEFLEAKRSGEELLLAPARLTLWTGYFSNENALYEVNNRVGAAALAEWMRPGSRRILELGGGLGSGAAAALERLTEVGRLGEVTAYQFTELVPAFLRRAQRLKERFPDARSLAFSTLDMNRSFVEQGVAPGTVSIVYAVNTLHVAHDLAATLREVRQSLEPGGQIIVSECIRPRPGQTLYPEFIFNLLETFRAPKLDPAYRPNGGFLTPEQWQAALEAAGFSQVRTLPDIAVIREVVPTFSVAAIGATRLP
jgi:SAM-dependent methyltransferase